MSAPPNATDRALAAALADLDRLAAARRPRPPR